MYISYFVASLRKWGFDAAGWNQYGMKYLYITYIHNSYTNISF